MCKPLSVIYLLGIPQGFEEREGDRERVKQREKRAREGGRRKEEGRQRRGKGRRRERGWEREGRRQNFVWIQIYSKLGDHVTTSQRAYMRWSKCENELKHRV